MESVRQSSASTSQQNSKLGIDLAITTRLMAKRLSNTPSTKRKSIDSTQLKFLNGTQIPNSTRRASIIHGQNSKSPSGSIGKGSRRSTPDNLSLLSRRIKLGNEEQNQNVPEQQASKITMKRMQKTANQETNAERKPKPENKRLSMQLSQLDIKERERRRTATSILSSERIEIPQARRKSTLEDIKEAIDRSQEIKKLMNADEIEKQKQLLENSDKSPGRKQDSFSSILNPVRDTKKLRQNSRESATQTSIEFEEVKQQLREKAIKQRKNSRSSDRQMHI